MFYINFKKLRFDLDLAVLWPFRRTSTSGSLLWCKWSSSIESSCNRPSRSSRKDCLCTHSARNSRKWRRQVAIYARARHRATSQQQILPWWLEFFTKFQIINFSWIKALSYVKSCHLAFCRIEDKLGVSRQPELAARYKSIHYINSLLFSYEETF